jgi:RNA polymerase sigma-70 factor, ECF subfamily
MTNFIAKQTEMSLTELEVIEKAKSGDTAAFECIYKLHSKRVYSLCLRMSKHPVEAEDLTQQVFLQVFRKIDTYRAESAFSTWLHRVALNIIFMHLRRKRVTEVSVEDLQDRNEKGDRREFGAPDNSMLGAIDRLNLDRALRKLPLGYRRIFLLYDVFGFEHNEIASQLKCTVGNSKSQLHKARRRLRRLLQGEESTAEAADVVLA